MLKQPLLRSLVLIALAIMESACSGNFHSIYRKSTVDVSKASVTMVDAKQRAILQNKEKFCTEPSPDVFSVMAQSASGTAALGKSSDPKTYEAQLAVAYASAEQGATIARTQTVNMLRELMYRTCERYLSGSISPLEMPIQAARDQRMMASMLAIEQLTGAIRPTVVMIGATANGGAGTSNADAAVGINKAFDDKASADKAVKTANDAYAKLNTTTPSCDDLIKADKAGTTIAAADQPRVDPCKKAALDVTNATKSQTDATDRVDALKAVGGQGGGGPVSAAGQTNASIADGGSNPAIVETVATAVTTIVEKSYAQDEFLFLCLKILSPESGLDPKPESRRDSDPDASSIKDLKERCMVYIKTSVDLQASTNRDLLATRVQIEESAMDGKFERFWNKPTAEKQKLVAAAPRGLGDAVPLAKLAAATDKKDAARWFKQVDPKNQDNFSK